MFHYVWILILIAFEAWRPPTGAVFPNDVGSDYHVVWYSNLAWSMYKSRRQITNFVFSGYFAQILKMINVVSWVPQNVIDKYYLQARLCADMHYIYVRARRDPNKTWNMGRFQLTLTKMDEIIAEWEPGWWKDIPIEDIVELDVEEEEDVDNKKEEEDDNVPTDDAAEEEDAGKDATTTVPTKSIAGKTKRGKGMKKKMTIDIQANANAMDQETINILNKCKLSLAELGHTPKKAQGSPA